MTHNPHRPYLESRSLLDPVCPECRERQINGLDQNYMLALLGMTRDDFDRLTDPSAGSVLVGALASPDVKRAQALLWAFRYAMRRELALKVAAEVIELQQRGRWPLSGPIEANHPWMPEPQGDPK